MTNTTTSASRDGEASKSDKDERAALIRRLREGQCADNMGCGTMKMCVCANATDAADYLEKLAAVPECGALQKHADKLAAIIADCAPWLKEEETPAECIARNRKDADYLLGELAKERMKCEALERETGFVRTAYDQLVARYDQEIERAKAIPAQMTEAVRSGCGTSTEGRSNAGAESPTVIRENAPSAPSTLSAIGTLLKVDERDPNHRECQRQDAALVHRILRLQEEVAKQHRAACDATGEAIHWKKVAQGNSPFTEVRSTRQPSDFTLDVCEALFGCFLDDGYEDDPHGTFRCGQCHEPIKITEWVNATHASSCIINKVRNVLREHRPAAAPLSATQERKG